MVDFVAKDLFAISLVISASFGLSLSLFCAWINFARKMNAANKRFDVFRELVFRRYFLTIRTKSGQCRLVGSASGGEQLVTIYTEGGSPGDVKWLGFITREECGRQSGRYVWLEAWRIQTSLPAEQKSVELTDGQFVQGWYTPTGVYAVTDNIVAVVSGTSARQNTAEFAVQ